MSSVLNAPTIAHLFARAALAYGDRPAIEDAGSISYLHLDRLRQQAARALLALGVKAGDRVAIWAPNTWEWIVAAGALHSVGAALVPLNTRMKGNEASYILRQSGSCVLFTIGEFLGVNYPQMLAGESLPELRQIIRLRSPSATTLDWDSFMALASLVPVSALRLRQQQIGPQTLSDVLFTSGTTGKPKGVMTCHGQNLRVVRDWSDMVGLDEGDRYLIVNPFFHSFGYKAGWLAALMRGATIIPQQIFDVDAVLECVQRQRISVLPGPPTLYQSLLAHPRRDAYDLSSLRVAVTGAAVIPVEMIGRMRDELGFTTIVTAYGLTEVCGFATICRPDDDPQRVAQTSGRAMPGVELRCVDANGRCQPPNVHGEIQIRGYNLMQGYLNDPQASQEVLDADGWLNTGDIGVLDEQGYLRITDRLKDMFITGGFNVYPAEIEQCLLNFPGVAQAAVIGVPDERLGEVAMAFLLAVPGLSLEQTELLAWCREHMANYKVPRRFRVLEALPLNAAGKVTKQVLREWASTQV
ncbi:Long-chain-fatty-acid--CoA ligase [Pseudomonas chlororaphis subsp. aureofaciens]|uniref:FadD3 family acyl-CoA ligase n=1 Tax=Pseudomonas chlororaphis TaxID=587753 RepID=UPI000F568610|nr:FadD3 family acyl-CoA ligase [Pseudomonas chlororaphis]AZD86953.1 Long-chain-fatty-acid--CoA ligase [Pseudomonas chlororaphis subsp. aureofaciens]